MTDCTYTYPARLGCSVTGELDASLGGLVMREAQSWSGRENSKLSFMKISYLNRSFVLQIIRIAHNKWVASVLENKTNDIGVLFYSTYSSLREAKMCVEELLERFLRPTSRAHEKSGGI